MEGKKEIIVRVILNVAGKPKEHVDSSMKLVVENIGKEKDIKILKKRVMKAQKKEELYFSSVAELEIRCVDSFALMGFCMDYLPASVEIIEPEDVYFDSVDLTNLLNDLLAKLHNVNINVGQIRAENELMQQNGERLLKNIVMLSIREEPKTIEQMAGNVGITAKQLAPFVEKFVKEGKIELKGERYRLKGAL